MRIMIQLASIGIGLLAAGTAQAQVPYFGSYYAFGDSLSDNGRVLRETGINPTVAVENLVFGSSGIYANGRWSNGLNYTEIVPALVGAAYAPSNGFAVGGAQSIHQAPTPPGPFSLSPAFAWGLPDQIDTFAARVGRFAPNDLINIWIGQNDPVPAATQQAAVAGIIGNITNSISRLASLGGRQFIVFSEETYTTTGTNVGNVAINNQLPGALAALSASGLNIHYFDVDALLTRVRANPTAYGFAPNAGTVNCNEVPACALNGATTGLENQYISPEGIHLTGAMNMIVANFLANQLNAPLTMSVQADMAQSSGTVFANSLLGRLDAYRYQNASASPSNAYAMYNKELPKQPVDPYGPWSIFAMGTYAQANQNAGFGTAGYNNDVGAGTVGFDYKRNPNLLLGGAFSYSDATTNLALENTKTELKSYQFAGFASATYANWFSDVVISYGLNDYQINRAGVGSGITASPDGNNFVATGKAGYLFDTAMLRLGPIVGFAYSKVWIDAYTEIGDPLLTQAVRSQNLEGWTGSAGVQFRLPNTIALKGFNPYLNLTAEQDFGGNVRIITTAQTYALNLPITTQAGDGQSYTYGKVAGGTTIDLGGRFSAMINAETTFARGGGNLAAVTVGFAARL